MVRPVGRHEAAADLNRKVDFRVKKPAWQCQSVCALDSMRFSIRDAGRLWFIACETFVIGTPLVLLMSGGDGLASYVELFMPTFQLAWLGLLLTSFVYLSLDRRFSVIGFNSCLFGACWALRPVLVV